jgi:branched-chain amino acid transport system permease protein
VGAAIVVIMKNVVSAYIVRWNLVLGVVFVIIITFMPEGLVPGSVRLWRWGWRRLRGSSGAAAPQPLHDRAAAERLLAPEQTLAERAVEDRP